MREGEKPLFYKEVKLNLFSFRRESYGHCLAEQ